MNKQQHDARRKDRFLHTCQHFNGVQNETCALGISYDHVGDDRLLPCLPPFRSGAKQPTDCTQFKAQTEQQFADWETGIKESLAKIMRARTAIVDRIESSGDESGEISPCPVCAAGALRYSRASNGHVHAACTTAECVSWME